MDGAEEERQSRVAEVYLAIISRYKEYIEEQEKLSVAELPSLVTPDNESIRSKAAQIKAQVSQSYDFDVDFYTASRSALEFIRSEVEEMVLPVQFWMSPEDTLRFMAGDVLDKCVLLCSILISLGNPSAKVLIHATEGAREVFVHYSLNSRVYLLNTTTGEVQQFDTKQELIEKVMVGKRAAYDGESLYEFNNITYESLF